MSGFLANLAGLALGQPPAGAARLSLPPRFSGSSQPDIATGLEQIETTPANPPSPSLSEHPPRQVEVRHQAPAASIVKAVPAPASPSRERSAPQALPMTHQTEHPPLLERATPSRTSSLPQHGLEQVEILRSVTETTAQAQLDPSVHTGIDRHVRNEPSSQQQAAPLSEAALANRVVVEREPRPVVNVTIDRVEVRAPHETPQPQAPRRAKPQPSVSLADYLGVRT